METLGARVGTTGRTIARIETGEVTDPKFGRICRIRDAVNAALAERGLPLASLDDWWGGGAA